MKKSTTLSFYQDLQNVEFSQLNRATLYFIWNLICAARRTK